MGAQGCFRGHTQTRSQTISCKTQGGSTRAASVRLLLAACTCCSLESWTCILALTGWGDWGRRKRQRATLERPSLTPAQLEFRQPLLQLPGEQHGAL